MRRAGRTMLPPLQLPGSLPAADLPPRKPRLWELTHTYETPNLPVQTAQHCVDAATDSRMRLIRFHPDQTACSVPQVKRIDGGFTVERACALASQRTRQRPVIAGDFSAAYRYGVVV